MTSTTTTKDVSRRERRRVLAATTIGTAIEWYDYFLYAAVAGLVFNQVMFGPLEGGMASIIAFLTVGISFLFRPLGAFLAGHYGDRLGRRFVLMVTLFAMGGATTLIGLLPTYDTLGYWAPLLLILLRIIQGISAAWRMGLRGIARGGTRTEGKARIVRRGPPDWCTNRPSAVLGRFVHHELDCPRRCLHGMGLARTIPALSRAGSGWLLRPHGR